MTPLFIYFFVMYLFAIGICIADFNEDKVLKREQIYLIIFAPLLIPVFLGMDYFELIISRNYITKCKKLKKDKKEKEKETKE